MQKMEAGMQTELNALTIAALVILLLFGLGGLKSGLVRKLSGLFSLVISLIFTSMFLPDIRKALKTSTPVYSMIESGVSDFFSAHMEDLSSGALAAAQKGLSGSSLGSSSTGSSGNADNNGSSGNLGGSGSSDSSITAPSVTDEQYSGNLLPVGTITIQRPGSNSYHVEENFEMSAAENPALPVGIAGAELLTASVDNPVLTGNLADAAATAQGVFEAWADGLSRVEQVKLIDALPLPEKIRTELETFNNSEGYEKVGAQGFGSYIVGAVSDVIFGIAAYLLTFLIVALLIRLILGVLNLFASLPVVRSVNALGGLAIGLAEGLLLIWILFLLLSLFSATPAGSTLMQQVYANPFLTTLYNSNIFAKIFSAGGSLF